MEKAFAKLYISYDNLSGGDCSSAMIDLMGGLERTIELASLRDKNRIGSGSSLWQFMYKAINDHNRPRLTTLVTASIGNSNYNNKGCSLLGSGHSFSVLDVIEVCVDNDCRFNSDNVSSHQKSSIKLVK